MRALLKLQPFDPDLDKWQEMDGRTFLGGWGGTNQENRMSEKQYQETKAGNTGCH